MRLFCLPYAAGSAERIYGDWQRALPGGIDVVPLELPGRASRFKERLLPHVDPLVTDALPRVLPLSGEPYALFGHSLGAILAFELARVMEHEHGRPPARLLVSGHAAPDEPLEPSLDYLLPDRQFKARLKDLAGTPPQVLENDDVMEVLLPLLRADFAAVGQWEHVPGAPLSCPITVFGGDDDHEAPVATLAGWSRQTTAGCSVHVLPGGHFFLNELPDRLLPLVAGELLGARV
ncbi:thioesterase [Streptosporangiaceae bacterium NEAU-GS5]|nr:thioesterase [Streptosporangiaceae bacterium NEAU-GS5]